MGPAQGPGGGSGLKPLETLIISFLKYLVTFMGSTLKKWEKNMNKGKIKSRFQTNKRNNTR